MKQVIELPYEADETALRRPATATTILRVPILSVADIVVARRQGRVLSEESGASDVDTTLVGTIISELARNIVLFAQSGYVELEQTFLESRIGITITAADEGPGITDVQRALLGGYSTCGRLGLGLSGVRRIADEFEVVTTGPNGTTVLAKKWFR